jgi:inner membrane protein involved in colicin E2 resistance
MANKKVVGGAGFCAILLFLLLWTGLRQHWFGENPLVQSSVALAIGVLGFPLKLYVMSVRGEHASWSLPMFVLLLVFTGVFWGLLVARLSAFARRRFC